MDAAALAALLLLAAGICLAALGTRRRAAPPVAPPPPPAAADPVPPGCPCEQGEKGTLELLAGREGADSLWRCRTCQTPYHFNPTDGTARPLTPQELARNLALLMRTGSK